MDITKAIEQVRSKLGDEKLPEVESVLNEIATEYGKLGKEVSELQGTLKTVNYESMQRRIELNKVNQQITEKDLKIEELSQKGDNEELQNEVENLREFRNGIIAKNRQGFVEGFAKITKHPNFEKIQGEFVLPEPDKEGAYDFKKTSDEDMDSNVEAFNRLNRIDYFATQSKQKVHGKTEIGTPEDWTAKLEKAETMEDLQALANNGMPS